MRKFALIVLIAIAPVLSGCGATQALRDDIAIVSSVQVSPKAVVVAAKSFNILEGLATDYLRLPRCNGTTTICRSPTITRQVIPAVRKGRAARDSLIAFQRSHPGQLGSQGAYDALLASIATLKSLIAQNNGAAK